MDFFLIILDEDSQGLLHLFHHEHIQFSIQSILLVLIYSLIETFMSEFINANSDDRGAQAIRQNLIFT